MTNSKYIYKGVSENVTECDCCGKVDLKRTVVLFNTGLNGFEYFGTTCAKKAANWSSDDFKNAKDDFKAEKIVENFNTEISNEKSDYNKAKLCSKAIKKGYDKDLLFKTHGTVLEITPWEIVYNIGHLVHRISK